MTATVRDRGVLAAADGEQRVATIAVSGAAFDQLRDAVNRSLNTNENGPQWLFDLADAMENPPLPKRAERATK